MASLRASDPLRVSRRGVFFFWPVKCRRTEVAGFDSGGEPRGGLDSEVGGRAEGARGPGLLLERWRRQVRRLRYIVESSAPRFERVFLKVFAGFWSLRQLL
jgi:hypothetical protein